jgi:hypothetical protein
MDRGIARLSARIHDKLLCCRSIHRLDTGIGDPDIHEQERVTGLRGLDIVTGLKLKGLRCSDLLPGTVPGRRSPSVGRSYFIPVHGSLSLPFPAPEGGVLIQGKGIGKGYSVGVAVGMDVTTAVVGTTVGVGTCGDVLVHPEERSTRNSTPMTVRG